jgi:PH (Pleckstrin Homology) domain-containing protein
MAQKEISHSPVAGNLLLRHAPGRTVAFVAIVFAWALIFGLQTVSRPSGMRWFDALGCLLSIALAYAGVVVAVQAIRGTPLLEASDAGIAVNSPWGRMFVRWSDTSEFSAGNYRWLRIHLREGGRTVGSPLTRILNASVWARRTIAVPAFTTAEHPAEIARRLTVLRTQNVANRN